MWGLGVARRFESQLTISTGYSFLDSSGYPLSNGCLVFPDHSFVFLDKHGQCDPKIVEEAEAGAVFDKRGNLILEWSGE